MTRRPNIASFVVRFTQELWRDADKEPHIRWRGQIRHVQGEEEDRFTDFAEAAVFMQRHLTKMTLDNLSVNGMVSQEKMLQESFKLWEQFATSYTKMMFQAMDQGIRQSKAFQEQVEETREKILSAWQLPFQWNDDQIVETMKEMQGQLESLSKRLDDLEKRLAEKE